MEADKRPSETETARQLREALNRIRANRSGSQVPESSPPPVPSTPETPPSVEPPLPASPLQLSNEPAPERVKTFGAPPQRAPLPPPPKQEPSPASPPDALLPLTPAAPPAGEEDPVERLRRLIEERRKQSGERDTRRPPVPTRPASASPRPSGPPTQPPPDEDPAARLRRLVDERRQKLATERGEPPPPPVEPRPPSEPAAAAPASPDAPGEDSPAERLRRMLEEHRRKLEQENAGQPAAGGSPPSPVRAPDDEESPAERLARMLEQRRRSNQIPPTDAAAGRPAAQPLPPGGGSAPPGNLPQPRDHLPPPEARKPQKQPAPTTGPDLAAFWRKMEGKPLGRMLKRLGVFYVRVAGVVLWTGVFLCLSWAVCLLALNGFGIFSAHDWQWLRTLYQGRIGVPWPYVATFGLLGALWIAGAVLVWRKGRPYVWPVLVALAQLALLPVALALALVAGVLMAVTWGVRMIRARRARAI